MSKKVRNIIIVFMLLAVSIASFFVLFNGKKEEDTPENVYDTIHPYLEFDEDTYLTDITLEIDENIVGFTFDDKNGLWKYLYDSEFPVDQTVLERLATRILHNTYIKSFSNVTDLSEYKLDKPVLKITFTVSYDELSHSYHTLLISEPESDGSFYFVEDGSDKVYLSKTHLSAYASYSLYDYMQLASIPSLLDYQLASIEFDSINGEYVKLFRLPSVNDSTVTYAYTTDKNLDMTYDEIREVYLYSSMSDRFLSEPNLSDIVLLMEKINEFETNSVVVYQPLAQELKEYGLSEPQTVVTFKFTDEAIDSVLIASACKISIGYPVPDRDNEYYVMFSSVSPDTNEYGTPTVYTVSASFAEYFLEMSEDSINGVNSGLVLESEAIPVLTSNTIESVEIYELDPNITFYGDDYTDLMNTYALYTAPNIIISYDDNGVLIYSTHISNVSVNDDFFVSPYDLVSSPIKSSVATQFFGYFSDTEKFKYNATVYDNLPYNETRAEILEKYGLLYPIRIYSFTYRQNEAITSLWNLYIGTDGKDFYVTASNSNNIYKMPDSVINYLVALNEKILSGDKVYEEN